MTKMSKTSDLTDVENVFHVLADHMWVVVYRNHSGKLRLCIEGRDGNPPAVYSSQQEARQNLPRWSLTHGDRESQYSVIAITKEVLSTWSFGDDIDEV